jgi:hypothetical protein
MKNDSEEAESPPQRFDVEPIDAPLDAPNFRLFNFYQFVGCCRERHEETVSNGSYST